MFVKPLHYQGVGINYRTEISDEIIKHIDEIDFIEVNTERFFESSYSDNLRTILNLRPVLLHGLTLSIGTLNQSIPESYLENLRKAHNEVECLWFSEHIAITNVNGIEIRSLSPTEFTDESVNDIAFKAKQIATLTGKPFLLENISYYYDMPKSYLSESEYITKIAEHADCGLLLDLNNLYVNSTNHNYDPYEYIDQLPLERVVEVHLAGSDYMHGLLIDTHASAVRDEVYQLLEYLSQKTLINGVVIERDAKLKQFSDLLEEVKIVRSILNNSNFIN